MFYGPLICRRKILELVKETKNALFLDYYVSLISIHPTLLQKLSDHKDIKECVSSIVSMQELKRIGLKPDKGIEIKFLKELLKFSGTLDEKKKVIILINISNP